MSLAELAHIREKVEDESLEIMPYELPLDYSYFPTEHVLKVRGAAVHLLVACHLQIEHSQVGPWVSVNA